MTWAKPYAPGHGREPHDRPARSLDGSGSTDPHGDKGNMSEQPHKRQKMLVCKNCNTENVVGKEDVAIKPCAGCGTVLPPPPNPLRQSMKKIMPM